MDRQTTAVPPLDVVLRTVDVLNHHGIETALGGSGLLAALGLTARVRDWDLTTDADPDAVRAALATAGLDPVVVNSGDGRYATRARYRVDGGDHEIDLIVGFAVRDDDGTTVPLPTRVTGRWQELPLGDPAVWARAYRLIGRREPAERLQRWLNR